MASPMTPPHRPADAQPAARAPIADTAVAASVDRLQAFAQAHALPLPRVAVLLGSGWSAVADRVDGGLDLPYAELPAFPPLHIEGHAAAVRGGRLGGAPVWVLRGRKHTYEDGDPAAMMGPIRTLAACGVQVLLQTNAAGSLEPAWRPGGLMAVVDHLNLVQRSPLVGERGSARFVDMGRAYDPELLQLARDAGRRLGLPIHEGVYAWVLGPQFETPAEIRMIARLGAQAVGMSTVPETILARHAGLRVLALSMLTNMGCGLDDEPLSHAQTLAAAAAVAPRAADWVEALVEAIAGLLDGGRALPDPAAGTTAGP